MALKGRSMGYCPRCGENSNLGSGPNIVAERRLPLRIPANTNIVRIPASQDGATIVFGGMRFKVNREGKDIVLWAVE